ncbi:MAG: HIT family protein [Nanobdellota archaeon]
MDCIFCKIANNKAKAYKIYETETIIAILDINPATKGHILILPKTHYNDLFDIPKNIYGQMQEVIYNIVQKLKMTDIKAVNVLNSSGKAAQQDVFHIHVHIIPRSSEDSVNFAYKTNEKAQKTLQKTADKLHKILN